MKKKLEQITIQVENIMNKSDSIKNLAAAMCASQAEMGGAAKSAENPFFNSKYANLSSIVRAIKEPFANHGLSYVQFPVEDGGRVGIETILMHESGEWLSNSFTVQLTKQDAQGAGSAITYCRRYGLQAVAGIPSEDDDGFAASLDRELTEKELAIQKANDLAWARLIKDGSNKLSEIKDSKDRARIAKVIKS